MQTSILERHTPAEIINGSDKVYNAASSAARYVGRFDLDAALNGSIKDAVRMAAATWRTSLEVDPVDHAERFVSDISRIVDYLISAELSSILRESALRRSKLFDLELPNELSRSAFC